MKTINNMLPFIRLFALHSLSPALEPQVRGFVIPHSLSPLLPQPGHIRILCFNETNPTSGSPHASHPSPQKSQSSIQNHQSTIDLFLARSRHPADMRHISDMCR
jgi:hypothetical protein